LFINSPSSFLSLVVVVVVATTTANKIKASPLKNKKK
jgi:hypothetical protein